MATICSPIFQRLFHVHGHHISYGRPFGHHPTLFSCLWPPYQPLSINILRAMATIPAIIQGIFLVFDLYVSYYPATFRRLWPSYQPSFSTIAIVLPVGSTII
jgi:hypothetical protein